MARRTRTSSCAHIQDSDPDSQGLGEDATATGGLPEYSAEGLEQLWKVVTEIIEGAAAAEQAVEEEEEEEEQADDGGDKNEAI